MLAHFARTHLQASGTCWPRHSVRREREIFRFEGCARFETNSEASITNVHLRHTPRANRTMLQAFTVRRYRTEVLAVAAVLPMQFGRRLLVTGKVYLTEDVTAVDTLNWILPRCEEPFFMLTTEYSHLSYSLRRCSRPQAVRCSTHKPTLSSGILR